MSLSITAEPIPLKMQPDGIVRVGETRVTLDTVVVTFKQGATAEEIVNQYPSLQYEHNLNNQIHNQLKIHIQFH